MESTKRSLTVFAYSARSSELPIWNIVAPDGTIVESSLRFDEAVELRDRLDVTKPHPVHHIVYRNVPPAGVP